MPPTRLSLFHYDVVRDQCWKCGAERFHFVPKGANPAPSPCRHCGMEPRVVDLSDTAVRRLVTNESGEMVIVATTSDFTS